MCAAKAVEAALTLPISLLLVRFPLAEFFVGQYHADAVWWSFPISSAVSAILALAYYKFGGWRKAHMLPAAPAV